MGAMQRHRAAACGSGPMLPQYLFEAGFWYRTLPSKSSSVTIAQFDSASRPRIKSITSGLCVPPPTGLGGICAPLRVPRRLPLRFGGKCIEGPLTAVIMVEEGPIAASDAFLCSGGGGFGDSGCKNCLI